MPGFHPPSPALLEQIRGITLWREAGDSARYFEDPRKSFTGQASLIALPETTAEVSEIVKLCNAEKAGIIPYGGGTGVVAGQLSRRAAMRLSFRWKE